MVQTGRQLGKKVAALITDMGQPLGRAVGNSLEVRESLEILRGERNPESEDFRELCLELSAWMFYLGRAVKNVQLGRKLGAELLSSGQAFAKFRTLCQMQGADPAVIDDPSRLPSAQFTAEYLSPAEGYLDCIDCAQVGLASLVLGGGRSNPGDVIDHAVGLELCKKAGEAVKLGERIATVHYDDAKKLPEALQRLNAAYCVNPEPTAPRVLIKKVIESA
jgi:pyrimidine-nucleoside phosphorylase